MGDIKPIETIYNGNRFRSRLEARWAVFFDALGVEYEYEPEGFQLPDGSFYLPDFRVKCYGNRGDCGDSSYDLWIEVKGRMTPEDARKIEQFAGHFTDHADEPVNLPGSGNIYGPGFQNPILVVGNIPAEGCSHDSWSLKAYDKMDGCDICPFNYELIDGDYFGAYPAVHKGKFYLWGDDSNYIWGVKAVEEAYAKARQARFEHGETPVTAWR